MIFKDYLKENINSDFPPLYHGTSSEELVKTYNFNTKDVYLTDEYEDAIEFAAGKHRLENLKTKYVLTIMAKKGKIFDGHVDVDKIIMEDHDDFDDLDDLMEWARHKGFRYVTFSHPSMLSDDYIEIVVSLHPNKDLNILDVDNV